MFTHIYRPEKANIKQKEKLPEEIFSADLTVFLRREISYLDYFKLFKERLYKEAVYSGPKSIMTELSCSFEGMAMNVRWLTLENKIQCQQSELRQNSGQIKETERKKCGV